MGWTGRVKEGRGGSTTYEGDGGEHRGQRPVDHVRGVVRSAQSCAVAWLDFVQEEEEEREEGLPGGSGSGGVRTDFDDGNVDALLVEMEVGRRRQSFELMMATNGNNDQPRVSKQVDAKRERDRWVGGGACGYLGQGDGGVLHLRADGAEHGVKVGDADHALVDGDALAPIHEMRRREPAHLERLFSRRRFAHVPPYGREEGAHAALPVGTRHVDRPHCAQ
jgi:hypothetical protein